MILLLCIMIISYIYNDALIIYNERINTYNDKTSINNETLNIHIECVTRYNVLNQ